MKILVAIPVYDSKLYLETVRCLLHEQIAAAVNGDEINFRFLPSCSHAAMGRNQLADDFLKTDADRLVFLDADVTFTPGAISRLAHHPVPFVGGAYRYKHEPEAYPVAWLDDRAELWANEHGLLEVKTLPGGFMALSREVFERMKAADPQRTFEHGGRTMHCYFQFRYTEGALYGEDSLFCKEWREIGGQVFLDPELNLTHWDFNKPYVGHIGNWLKSRAGHPTPSQGVQA